MDQPNVVELKALMVEHPDWEQMLVDSLQEAKVKAIQKGLKIPDPDTFPEGLEGEGGYYDFLNKGCTLIPREDYPKEVFYVLGTFYWLLDQPPGKELQKHDAFNTWMRDFANDWGAFLNTPESAAGIEGFKKDPAYAIWQYDEPPGGWTTFNEFFWRIMKPGLRTPCSMHCDDIITSPADSVFKKKFPIDDHSEVLIKHTHKYKIRDLLKGSPYDDEFEDGLFYHAFLGPNDFHRFASPARGTVLESRAIQENVYLQVGINEDGFFTAPDDAGYQFTQTRGLLVLDTPVGLIAVLPIGMAQVSSVNMTAVEGAYLDKGDEFGYFGFGGSDIILLFQKRSGVEVTAAPGIHYNCGMGIAAVF